MIRAVVVDDSITQRELMVRILESDPDIRVVGQGGNGVEAVALANRLRPDLVAMDVHMPVMDGFEAAREIMIQVPTPIVMVSSSVSGRETDLSLDAIRAGALMVIRKPGHPDSSRFDGRREELLNMMKAMATVKVVRRWAERSQPQRPSMAPAPPTTTPVRLIAMAASTGGPAALQQIFSNLPTDFPAPILVVQHIATGFVGGLADWLNGLCEIRIKVAEAGERPGAGTIYLAPDDHHLGLGGDGRVVLAHTEPVGGFRPSATYLFRSAAALYHGAVAGVVLTGMGSDGVDGLQNLKAAGGRVLAQDEATSVVYGMPAAAVNAGVVDSVLPVNHIAAALRNLVAGFHHHGR